MYLHMGTNFGVVVAWEKWRGRGEERVRGREKPQVPRWALLGPRTLVAPRVELPLAIISHSPEKNGLDGS